MRLPTLVVLGSDAFLAARPSSPVQLTHAALAVGFDAAIPASWGDELVAAACVRELAGRSSSPALFCACPHVAHRVLATGAELSPFLVSLLPPPAALARHLRAFYEPGLVRLTYVGSCPGAHGAYDAIVAPGEFLRLMADRGITPANQPEAFEAVVPPDRRRHYSLPGGLPALTALRSVGAPHDIVELTGSELAVDLAQQLLSNVPILVDAAPRLGCSCAGAAGESPGARAALIAIEPPRAFAPVIAMPTELDLGLPLPKASRDAIDVIAATPQGAGSGTWRDAADAEAAPVRRPSAEQEIERDVSAEADIPPRRRSPASGVPVVRPPAGYTPIARANDGRVLPRAYVARRRSGGRPIVEDTELAREDESEH